MTSSGRYSVIETPFGWRVVERNSNGEKVLDKQFRSEASAWRRANQLTSNWLLQTTTTAVRKRSGNRCECLGECGRGHKSRCPLRDGEHNRVPNAKVVVSVVTLDHSQDLREANLRAYCQLCRCYHDAEAEGITPLFVVGEVEE